ncbi:uncharacterized protein LOC117640193 isoform X3 [Thrips palmi]|uniref:Uncharacterized protein LOC117640193 isoform X3 n=1 Tax=Thrips palmi TaxID=161013 RepID=A0A6P8YEY2_THRPL|nr:uncharacterized protein LOC117640193 isoform X3 [Thrips palmi]
MEDGMDDSSSNEYDSSTDSSAASSQEDSSLGGSDNSSSSSEESLDPLTKLEDCKVNGTVLQLPQGLCEQEDVFQQLLSHETWKNLSSANREHLKKFLPTFTSNNDAEQEASLQLLFSGENMRFGNPLKDFHRNLKNGYYRPDIARMRCLLKKALSREYNYSQKRYYFRVMKSVLVSRQKLLQAANILPPGVNPKVPKLPAPPRTQHLSTREFRTRRRYFQELRAVRQEVGESGHSSDDENYPEGPPAQMNKKLKRRLSVLETSLCPEMRRVVSTLAAKPAGLDLAANVTASNNPYEISDDAYRNMLVRHKKRRLAGDVHPELNCLGRSLHDVVDRANRIMSKKGLPSGIMKFESPLTLGKQHSKQVQKRRNSKVQQESAVPSPGPIVMADSSDMAESDDDDVISVTRLTEDTDKLQKVRDKKLVEKDKENESKERGKERDLEKEREKEKVVIKDKEQEEWDKFIGNDADKLAIVSSPRASTGKPKKKNVVARPGKPNNLSGLPTSRRILKGELENAVDNILNTGTTPSLTDTKSLQTVKEPPTQSIQTPKLLLQDQLKEEDVGVKVVQTTTSFPTAQNSSLLQDLSNIDMMSLPIDIEEPEGELNIEYAPPTPSLMQDTHLCFFSLLRDLICTAREQSMSLSNLQAGLRKWQESPISPLNDWYPLAANSGGWVASLTSALTFLSGQLPDMHPDEFVPYLEYKPALRKYQWIGAGRDSDNLLMPLCTYWLERRDEAAEMQSRENKKRQDQFNSERDLDNIYVDDDEMGATLPVDPSNDFSDRVESPLPSCNPTDWIVVPTTLEEKLEFRSQELERFANPLRAFTYKMHGYDSVVGPLRGVYSTGSGNVKPRGHSLLVSDRPNYVTILALVRDAVARLPNGQGTRMDICELLKDSQYLKPGATEQTVQSVVSGALDRLHYEPDPCVKYEPKRKIWICLHRSRSMEEYEQMHQQQQGMGKYKNQRKTGSRVKKEKDNKAETKAAVATVANAPRLVPQVEAEVTNMPTGLHTIQVTTRPAVSLTSGSLWNTPMELPLLPSTTSSTASTMVSTPSATAPITLSTPSPSPRTILSGRLPSSPAVGRKSSKKQILAVESVDTIAPVSASNVRSVLSSPSATADGSKPVQQQILMGGRLISSTAGRKSLVMTSSSGVQQVMQLATPSKQSTAGTVISSQGTVILSASPITVNANTTAVCNTTSSSTVQWATVATSPGTGQRPTMVIPQPQQSSPKKTVEVKRTLAKPSEASGLTGLTQTVTLDANAQRQLKQQQQLLLMKQRQQQAIAQQVVSQQTVPQQVIAQQVLAQQAVQQQAVTQQAIQQQVIAQQVVPQQSVVQQGIQPQTVHQAAQQQTAQQQQIQQHQQFQLQLQQQQQIQLQQQLQAQQLQQVQPQLQAIQPQEPSKNQDHDQRVQALELDSKQQEQLQQQKQQKIALPTVQKQQLQQQTLQLLQQQLKDKPGALSLSNIQLVDQSGTVMAVQTSESGATIARPRQNLVLVRQAGGDQAALTAMVQKQQQLLLLKQKQQQSVKELSEAQQQQLQLRQRQVQELLKQQLKAQQAGKVQPAAAQGQLQQQIVVVSGSSQQQVKQQLTAAQQKQAQTQLVVLKQPRGQGQLVNAVGGILPQQMFVVKTKAGAGQKQVLTQLTAEQQAGLLALQRQQQQQLQIQQQQQQQPQQQLQQQPIAQQQHLQQNPPPLQLQQQPVTTAVSQIQLVDQSQQRQQIQQVLQSQGKGVRGTSILGQGILTTAALTSSTVTTASAKQGPPPMVAKVVTNSHGQLITMEALQAQSKAGTLRVAPAVGKAGQPNQLIQIAGSGTGSVPQFAVVSQGNIISLASSINTQRIVPQALTLSASGSTTTAVTASKMSAGIMNATISQPSGNLRMVGGTGLNIAHIGGKPVLLASKQQGLQGQNVILTSPGGGQQTVLLASQPLRPASSVSGTTSQPAVTAAAGSNAVVLQQAGGTQQILLPPGFQGGTINLKSIQGIQGLQGLKVIPVAQATQADGTKGRSQMFARIISPSTVRASGVQQQQAIGVAVAAAGTAGTTTVAAAHSAQAPGLGTPITPTTTI